MWELILCNFITGKDKTYRFDEFSDAVRMYKQACEHEIPCIPDQWNTDGNFVVGTGCYGAGWK